MLVNTLSGLESLLKQLRHSGIFALDMEGRELGAANGKLSVISFRTLDDATYLVDVLAFTTDQLQPLFSLLADSSVTKLVWDGRMDASELLHGHGVQLRGAADLQIADIMARRKRESFYDQKRRLSRGYRGIPASLITEAEFADVHRLNGLRGAAEDYGVIQRPVGLRGPQGPKFDHSRWLQRPLTAEQVVYATEDVDMILALYRIFKARGDIQEEDFKRQTEMYHSIHSSRRPDGSNAYLRHSLMPLDILDLPPPNSSLTPCNGCRRKLSQRCFSSSSYHGKCLVCSAMDKEQAKPAGGRGVRYVPRSDLFDGFLFA
ncbi:ribonuclease H-like domain-containing protein [Schizophyllum commune]